MHCNKYTGLQYAVPTRVRMRFGPPPYRGNLNIACDIVCDIVCDAACNVQVKLQCRVRSGNYDIVRPTYDVVGTYDIVRQTYNVVGSDIVRPDVRHRTYDIVRRDVRCRRGTMSYVPDVRCRTSHRYITMSYVRRTTS